MWPLCKNEFPCEYFLQTCSRWGIQNRNIYKHYNSWGISTEIWNFYKLAIVLNLQVAFQVLYRIKKRKESSHYENLWWLSPYTRGDWDQFKNNTGRIQFVVPPSCPLPKISSAKQSSISTMIKNKSCVKHNNWLCHFRSDDVIMNMQNYVIMFKMTSWCSKWHHVGLISIKL